MKLEIRPMKPTYEQALAAEVELSTALDAAWKAALAFTGCVHCAAQEINDRISMAAWVAQQEIIGEQPAHTPAIVPQAKGGISRTCDQCQGGRG